MGTQAQPAQLVMWAQPARAEAQPAQPAIQERRVIQEQQVPPVIQAHRAIPVPRAPQAMWEQPAPVVDQPVLQEI